MIPPHAASPGLDRRFVVPRRCAVIVTVLLVAASLAMVEASGADPDDVKWDERFVVPGASDEVDALALDSSGNLYAAGRFTSVGNVGANFVARWECTSWSALGSGISGNNVAALAVDGSGGVYAGGWFSSAGGVSANNFAHWDGT